MTSNIRVPGRLVRRDPYKIHQGCLPIKEFAANNSVTVAAVKRWIPKGKAVGYKSAGRWYVKMAGD